MKSFQIISPVNNKVFAERPYADSRVVEKALELSQKAFQSWKNTPIAQRAEICTRAIGYFKKKAEVWSHDLTMQMGRPIRYTPLEIRNGFAERAEYMIGIAEESLAEITPPPKEGFQRFIKKEPLGTVLVLAPWNYPYLTAVNAVFPAIMAGNTVILKHSEQTALCAEQFQEAFQSAGLPGGVLQYLHIRHNQVADIIADKRIAHIAFTGSVEGGKAIQKAASKRFITAGFELGGKDPAYVASDADIPLAAENLADGSFFNSGQSCCGVERIYVDQNVYDDFTAHFVQITKQLVMGDPLLPETTLGPMARISNAKRADKAVDTAIRNGAKNLVSPGDFPALDVPWLAPAVLVNVAQQMEIMQEEVFAPVVCIIPVTGDDEAVRLMNDSPYGLTASIWTSDPEKALMIGNRVETGTWYMNRCDYPDPALAWTGVKNSGRGCTLSALGYDHLTRPKSYHLKLNRP